jgi:hypothetical protein
MVRFKFVSFLVLIGALERRLDAASKTAFVATYITANKGYMKALSQYSRNFL